MCARSSHGVRQRGQSSHTPVDSTTAHRTRQKVEAAEEAAVSASYPPATPRPRSRGVAAFTHRKQVPANSSRNLLSAICSHDSSSAVRCCVPPLLSPHFVLHLTAQCVGGGAARCRRTTRVPLRCIDVPPSRAGCVRHRACRLLHRFLHLHRSRTLP